jgi:DNA-binding response OmpR family regulator
MTHGQPGDDVGVRGSILVLDEQPGPHYRMLEKHGYTMQLERRPERFTSAVDACRPLLIVLGLSSWSTETEALVASIRGATPAPLLILASGLREPDLVAALEAGVDECLERATVSQRLLLARVRNLLNRSRGTSAQGTKPSRAENRLEVGSLTVDPAARIVTLDGREIRLTDAEFDLLRALAKQPGCILSRDQISESLRGTEYNGLDRSIDLRISRLRKKLGDDARDPKRIKSVRGAGYILVPEP